MYHLADIVELKVMGVRDRGVPNLERIVMRAWEAAPVNLARFVITLGWSNQGGAMPIPDHMFWFGELQIQPNQWLFIYTGPGTARTAQTKVGEPLFAMHWNRQAVAFTDSNIVPVLMQLSAVAVDRSPDYVTSGGPATFLAELKNTLPASGAPGEKPAVPRSALQNPYKPK
jgi:hypothetical protein